MTPEERAIAQLGARALRTLPHPLKRVVAHARDCVRKETLVLYPDHDARYMTTNWYATEALTHAVDAGVVPEACDMTLGLAVQIVMTDAYIDTHRDH